MIWLRWNHGRWLFIFALFMVFFMLWPRSPSGHGNQAPTFEAYSIIDRGQVTLPIPDEQPAVLIFWAISCGACKIEMARLQDAILTGKVPPGRVWAVNISDSRAAVEDFAARSQWSFQYFVTPTAPSAYGVTGTPTVLMIDEQGRTQWRGEGIQPQSIERAAALW